MLLGNTRVLLGNTYVAPFQAVKVKAQSLFRGKQSSSEACNVFPCSLNTIVRYHIGRNLINAFYFPTNELLLDPGKVGGRRGGGYSGEGYSNGWGLVVVGGTTGDYTD